MANRDGELTGRTVLVALIVTGMVFGGLFVRIESATAGTLDVCVPGCAYATISDAMAAASAGDTISVGAGTYVENLAISTDVTIVGAGAAQTIIDGGTAGRVVFVTSGTSVTITDLEITHGLVTASGSPSPNGGGIYNEGDLLLERVRVAANTVADGGAGIFNLGSLTVVDSTITGNTGMTDGTGSIGGGGIASAGPSTMVSVSGSSITDNQLVKPGTDDRGGGGISVKFGDLTVSDSEISNNSSGYSAGGIFVSGSGATFTLTRSTVSGNRTGTDPNRATGRGGGLDLRNSASSTITESTISGNAAASGGGGLHVDASTTIVNSTISGNQAATVGGGIFSDVSVSLSSVTIAGNAAGTFGGGIYGFGDTILTSNSIIADNTAVDGGPDCYTTISVSDASLVETADGTICLTAGAGTVITGIDPQLGLLQDNGGSTLTHLPAATSPVVDEGATTLTVDQRGEPRPSGAAPDIGSVEIQTAQQGLIELLPNWGALGAWTVVRSLPIDGSDCGWSPGETVDIRWDEIDLTSVTADADGCFEEMISLSAERLAGSVPGPHKVVAAGTTSDGAAQAAFDQVAFELFVQPVIGGSGTPVTFSGCGWDGASTVNVYWLDTGDPVGRSNVDGSGCIDGSGDVPDALDGFYALGATVDGTAPGGPPDTSATAFRIAPAAFDVFPAQGPAGSTVTLTGSSSWYPGEQVEFVWETTGELLATFNVGPEGQITRTANAGGDLVFQVPPTTTVGAHDILARGLTSRQAARQPFQVVDEGLVFDPPQAEPGAVVAASGCGWGGNDTVTLEWGAVDPNGNNPSWLANVDFITGCFGENGSFTFTVPDNTRAGDITVTATGNDTGQASAIFTVIHGGSIRINGGGFGCCDVGPGDSFDIEVTGAIVGELVEFFFDDGRLSSEGGPVFLTAEGAASPDFTVTATVPLDARFGRADVNAVGTKGLQAADGVFVRDGHLVVDTTRLIYPGTVITVEGSGFGSGEVVDLDLRSLDAFGSWELGRVTVADGATTFQAEVQIPFDLDGGRYEIQADGSYGRFPDREIVLQTSPFFARAAAGAAPTIDGVIAQDEWDLTDPVFLPNGTMTFHNDDNRLHILVDMTEDSGADSIGSGDSFSLVVDIDGDGDIDPGDDIVLTLDGDELVIDEFTGVDSFTRRNTPFLTSTYAAGFDCFFADGSAVLDESTGAVTCEEHRVWEIGVDLSGIAAEPGDVVRLGVATRSQTPTFDDRLPSTLTSELRALGAVRLSVSQLPQPVPTGDILGVGSGGFDIEVTQAVQDAGNSLPLVARKDTAVRVYPDVDAESLVRVYLYGERSDGSRLPGSPLVTLATVPDTIDREILEHTANFLLPESWTLPGVTTLIARAESLDGQDVATTVEHSFVFTERGEPVIWYVPINTGTTSAPTLIDDSRLTTQLEYLETVYPLSAVQWVPQPWTAIGVVTDTVTTDGAKVTDLDVVNAELNDYYDDVLAAYTRSVQSGQGEPYELPDQIYGFTPSGGGLADAVWGGGGGMVASGYWGTSREGTLAHEVNHNLDEQAAGTWGRHVSNPDDNDDTSWGCGAGGPNSDWQELDDEIGEVGFDTRLPWAGGTGSPRTAVPANYPDFMSYCQSDDEANGDGGQRPTKWISPYRWQKLFADLAEFTVAAAPSTQLVAFSEDSTSQVSASSDTHVSYVSGRVHLDGTGALDPVVVQPGIQSPVIAPGDYSIDIVDGEGAVLLSQSFTAFFTDIEGNPRETVHFNYRLPSFADAAAVVLRRGASVLETIERSPNPPDVTVTSPSGGETWSGPLETVEWEATDADGDPLSFDLQYTPDGGSSWYPVARGLTATSHVVDVSLLAGGDQGGFLVVASDGFNTSEARSSGFVTVPAPGARVSISRPADGATIAPDARFELRGAAFEPFGGELEGVWLVWTVDGGPVAIGAEASLRLPEGVHEIGLTARDESGLLGETSVHVRVTDEPPVAPQVTATLAMQTVDYSDGITPVTIWATDPDSRGLTLSGVPVGVAVEGGCDAAGQFGETCTWMLRGTVDDAQGVYEATISDGYLDRVAHTITVLPEGAGIAFHGANPVAVPVTEAGSDPSEPFSLTIRVTETEPDSAASGEPHPGDLGVAEPSIRLAPVAGGPEVEPESCEVARLDGDGYDAEVTYRCAFNDVPVGLYSVVARVGGGFFTGWSEDVLSVIDPSLGMTSGSGSFQWPDTNDRTTFAFSMEYNRSGKNVKGALILVRHVGTEGQYTVKSNVLYGLSLGESADPAIDWASFSGKATYAAPDMEEPEGNHEFLAYAEDGVADRFWIEIRDKDGTVIGASSMPRPGSDHAVRIDTGGVDIR